MISRVRRVSVAASLMLTVASVCLAQDTSVSDPREPGYGPGKGGIGFQLGASSFVADADYSAGAAARFGFAAQFRYAMRRWVRWQISPGFTWAGYDANEPAPFRDPNFPADSTKGEYLTLLLPVSAQLQLVFQRGSWVYYAGGGPGLYRVWVENRRKVLKDPDTKRLHRGVYPGATAQIGAERFLKAFRSISIEFTVDGHWVFAERSEQFTSGFNSSLLAVGGRIGANYYFDLLGKRSPEPETPSTPGP
jgi:hypothetical protein